MNTVDKASAFYEKYVKPFIEENDLDGYTYTIYHGVGGGVYLNWRVDLFDNNYLDYYINLETGEGEIMFREYWGDSEFGEYGSYPCDCGGALYLRGY